MFGHYLDYRKALCVLSISLGMFCFLPAGNCQTWLWARGATGCAGGVLGTDLYGHVYSCGTYSSPTIIFGGVMLINVRSDSSGDVFLVKYDTLGNVIWAKSYGGNSFDGATCVTTDALGNIYMAGAFESSSITFGTTTLVHSAGGDDDMFIVKIDSSGNVIWARSAGGSIATGDVVTSSVMTDGSGNVYVTGDFSSFALAFGATMLTNTGGDDMFLVKFSTIGDVIWAKSAHAAVYDVRAVIDTTNNIYVTGSFGSSISFGTTTLTGTGGYNEFLAKYDTAGNVIWVKSAAGATSTSAQYSNAVAIDIAGNIFISGYFNSPSLIFDTITLTNSYSPSYVYFTAKYDSSGKVVWARNSMGSGENTNCDVKTDNSGNVYTAGAYNGPSISFGSGILYNTNPGNNAIFVTKYDAAGNNKWTAGANGIAGTSAGYFVVNDFGQAYLSGIFNLGINFGTTALIGGNNQYFLARLDTAYNQYAAVATMTSISKNISLYPNPNNGEMNLIFSGASYTELKVKDCLGRTVYMALLTGTEGSKVIELYSMPAGVYYLNAVGNGESENIPFVIRK